MASPVAFKRLREDESQVPDAAMLQFWGGHESQVASSHQEEQVVSEPSTENVDEKSPKFVSFLELTGAKLKRIAELDDDNDLQLDTKLDIKELLVSPILVVRSESSALYLTGDIDRSKRMIALMDPNKRYQVILTDSQLKTTLDNSKIKSKPKLTGPLNTPKKAKQPYSKPKISKGEIARAEAAALGISPAALRKRKSRARLRASSHEAR